MKKLFVILSILLIAIIMSACGQLKSKDGVDGSNGQIGAPGSPGSIGDTGPQGPAAPTPAPVIADPVQLQIDALVLDENTYRQGLGQTQLTLGLSCTLYTITGGDRIQATIAGHNTLTGIVQVATFLFDDVINQPDSPVSQTLNLLPVALRATYTNMYLLRCQGQVVMLSTDYFNFDLTSDDGSVLYIDGAKTVDNDNGHGSTLVSGQKFLRKGVHTFRLDYAQSGGGNQNLVLNMSGQSIDKRLYFH